MDNMRHGGNFDPSTLPRCSVRDMIGNEDFAYLTARRSRILTPIFYQYPIPYGTFRSIYPTQKDVVIKTNPTQQGLIKELRQIRCHCRLIII